MTNEQWKTIDNFEDYSISSFGRVRSDKTDRILSLNPNQFGVIHVGLMRNGTQFHRSVPLLVARAFLEPPYEAYDTPINLDGDRTNNRLENLLWRPRWFAIRYNQQFRHPSTHHISSRVQDLKTGEISENSFECAKRYGLLEKDIVQSIMGRTYVWPTYQQFHILGG